MRAIDAATGRVALYFALPPAVAALACAALAGEKMPSGIVLALEKPFGTDLASARALNRLLQTFVDEKQVFRVDHFLGKSTVLNLLGLRFANRIFEPLLSAQNVAHVEIVYRGGARPRGPGRLLRQGGRADRHDPEPPAAGARPRRHGAAVVASAPRTCAVRWPRRFGPRRVVAGDRDRSRRARYTAGKVGGRTMPAYASEKGVDPARKTETLAEMTRRGRHLAVGRRAFVLRSGKALGDPRQEIVFTFQRRAAPADRVQRPLASRPGSGSGSTRTRSNSTW